jgi:hypothetical protein
MAGSGDLEQVYKGSIVLVAIQSFSTGHYFTVGVKDLVRISEGKLRLVAQCINQIIEWAQETQSYMQNKNETAFLILHIMLELALNHDL